MPSPRLTSVWPKQMFVEHATAGISVSWYDYSINAFSYYIHSSVYFQFFFYIGIFLINFYERDSIYKYIVSVDFYIYFISNKYMLLNLKKKVKNTYKWIGIDLLSRFISGRIKYQCSVIIPFEPCPPRYGLCYVHL